MLSGSVSTKLPEQGVRGSTFKVPSIRNPLFTTIYSPALSLHSNPFCMAFPCQTLRLLKILRFLIMRHIHHDRVDRERRDCLADLGFVLGMVDVQRQWDGCALDGMGGRVRQQGKLRESRWEELDDQGRALCFCGADEGCELFDVVAGSE